MNKLTFVIGAMMSLPVMAETLDATQLKTYGADQQNVVYVFTSPTCPHCATFHKKVLPELKKKIADTGLAQIKLVDMAVDHKALKVSQLGRCMTMPQYEKYMSLVYHNQSQWEYAADAEAKIKGYASEAGLNDLSIQRCWDNQTLADTITGQWQQLAKNYRVTGMPTTVLVKGIRNKAYVGADTEIISEIKDDLTKK